MPQAITAAVLRSGYQSFTGDPTDLNPFAVNLDSRRTRLARRYPGTRGPRRADRLARSPATTSSGASRKPVLCQYTRAFRACAPPSATTFPPADPNAATAGTPPA